MRFQSASGHLIASARVRKRPEGGGRARGARERSDIMSRFMLSTAPAARLHALILGNQTRSAGLS